jgi:hypothetical protein
MAVNFAKPIIAVAAVTATGASAQTAREIRGPTPYIAVENEPAPKLIVDHPLAEGLKIGVFWAQYRVENMHIVPVFGPGTASVSPRVGHLHVIVDDGPFWWADASDNNTVDIANFAPGPHKVTIRLVDADHTPVAGQETTLHFTIPPYEYEHVHTH